MSEVAAKKPGDGAGGMLWTNYRLAELARDTIGQKGRQGLDGGPAVG
jgi:hypothetical protein